MLMKKVLGKLKELKWDIFLRVFLASFLMNPIWLITIYYLNQLGGKVLVFLFCSIIPGTLYGLVAVFKEKKEKTEI